MQMKCLRLRHTSGVYFAQVIQVNQMVLQLDTLPWISGEPSGQESNVFGPLEMLAEEICLAMAATSLKLAISSSNLYRKVVSNPGQVCALWSRINV